MYDVNSAIVTECLCELALFTGKRTQSVMLPKFQQEYGNDKHVYMFFMDAYHASINVWNQDTKNVHEPLIHENMSIWTMKAYERQDEIPSLRGS